MYEGIIQDLIDELGRLPGVGPKSAQRIAFHIIQSDRVDVSRLAEVLKTVNTIETNSSEPSSPSSNSGPPSPNSGPPSSNSGSPSSNTTNQLLKIKSPSIKKPTSTPITPNVNSALPNKSQSINKKYSVEPLVFNLITKPKELNKTMTFLINLVMLN
jgi:hypothetical protein